MKQLIDAIAMFLMVLAVCIIAFAALFGIGWLWGMGLFWTLAFGWWAPIAYITVTICFLPAIAITHSILEER